MPLRFIQYRKFDGILKIYDSLPFAAPGYCSDMGLIGFHILLFFEDRRVKKVFCRVFKIGFSHALQESSADVVK